jgi:hypothetical protein
MEVHTHIEAWDEDEFLHTIVLLREGEQWYYAETERRCGTHKDRINPKQLQLTPVPAVNIFPQFPPHLTEAGADTNRPGFTPDPEKCYTKHPTTDLLGWGVKKSLTVPSNLLINEAQVYETLKKNPHPNIAQYHGCNFKEGRITSLCLVKYKKTLWERVNMDPRPFDIDNIMRGIWAGIDHLHSLGLIHCDMKPDNVFMEDDDTPIIGDFDACCKEGERLGEKLGTPGWTVEDFKWARRQNDAYGILRIEEWLVRESKARTVNLPQTSLKEGPESSGKT